MGPHPSSHVIPFLVHAQLHPQSTCPHAALWTHEAISWGKKKKRLSLVHQVLDALQRGQCSEADAKQGKKTQANGRQTHKRAPEIEGFSLRLSFPRKFPSKKY